MHHEWGAYLTTLFSSWLRMDLSTNQTPGCFMRSGRRSGLSSTRTFAALLPSTSPSPTWFVTPPLQVRYTVPHRQGLPTSLCSPDLRTGPNWLIKAPGKFPAGRSGFWAARASVKVMALGWNISCMLSLGCLRSQPTRLVDNVITFLFPFYSLKKQSSRNWHGHMC